MRGVWSDRWHARADADNAGTLLPLAMDVSIGDGALANARAHAGGEKTREAVIDGATWSQPTFPYQAKCLRWTTDAYQALSTSDRRRVDGLLAGTGIEAMLPAD